MCHDFAPLQLFHARKPSEKLQLFKGADAGFPGSSNKHEGILPGIKPAGLISCPRPDSIATHLGQLNTLFSSVTSCPSPEP